jgi:plasmid stabilization system protein ParE
MNRATFEVVWSPAAVSDLDEILAFIEADRPVVAEQILDRIAERAATLATLPKRGRAVPELILYGISQIREVVEAPRHVIYRIDDRVVRVLAILDGRRDAEEWLLARLLH